MTNSLFTRSCVSLLALPLASYLCLATSPPPPGDPRPPTTASLDVPFGPSESVKFVRVLATGASIVLSVGAPEAVGSALERTSSPLEFRDCDEFRIATACIYNRTGEFVDFTIRLERRFPSTNSITVSFSADVDAGSVSSPTDLANVWARGVDLELLP